MTRHTDSQMESALACDPRIRVFGLGSKDLGLDLRQRNAITAVASLEIHRINIDLSVELTSRS